MEKQLASFSKQIANIITAKIDALAANPGLWQTGKFIIKDNLDFENKIKIVSP